MPSSPPLKESGRSSEESDAGERGALAGKSNFLVHYPYHSLVFEERLFAKIYTILYLPSHSKVRRFGPDVAAHAVSVPGVVGCRDTGWRASGRSQLREAPIIFDCYRQ